jgi:hypothetical protein
MKYCPLTNSKLGQHTIVQLIILLNRIELMVNMFFLAHPTKYDHNFWSILNFEGEMNSKL